MPAIIRQAALVLILALSIQSCQRYTAKPLALEQDVQQWSTQDRAWLQQKLANRQPHRQFNLDDGIDLAEAEVVALFFNPHIRLTRLELAVPAAAFDHSARWEDPELGIDGDYILADVDDPLVAGATLAITIPLSGRRNARRQLAQARLQHAQQAVIVAEWTLLQTLRQRWAHAAKYQRLLELHKNFAADIAVIHSQSRQLINAQLISANDAQTLDILKAQEEQRILELQQELERERLALLQLLGLHPDQHWQLQFALPEQPALEVQDIGIEQHPHIQLQALAYVIAERRLQLEIRKQYPDIQIGLGGGTEDGESRLLFGFNLLPLPIWNKNTEGIAAAKAERSISSEQARQAVQQIIYRHRALRDELAAQDAQLLHLEQTLIPVVEKQLDSARQWLRQGNGDIFHIIDALRSLVDARERAVTLHHHQRQQQIELAAMLLPFAEQEQTTGADDE